MDISEQKNPSCNFRIDDGAYVMEKKRREEQTVKKSEEEREEGEEKEVESRVE